MLNFTVVVTAYDNDAYLPACLQSVANQTFPNWHCIVVNDASPDSTSEIAHFYQERDCRFQVLDLPRNQGRHLARKRGVSASDGDYLLFLDADDELAPCALEQIERILRVRPVDSLHFGIDVISCGVAENEANTFESYINTPSDPLGGTELCEAIFTKQGGYCKDWRVTQRVYRIDVAKRAFSKMTDNRLDRAEDCYEVLVLADHVNEELTANEIRGLRYFYGRGVTGTSLIKVSEFNKFVDQFQECIDAMEEYAHLSNSGRDVQTYVDDGKLKLYDLLMNDWSIRLREDDQEQAARYASSVVGALPVATQLMRLSCDESYAAWGSGLSINGQERYISWFHLAEELANNSSDAMYQSMRLEVRDHIADLERRSIWLPDGIGNTLPIKASSYEKQDVRIFVTTHKDVDIFYSDILQPVQVGPVNNRKRLMWAYQDDSGDNIASLNPMYCELTTQYWAWKNVSAEYYGFCHYRRYFDFSDVTHEENSYGEVIDDRIGWKAQCLYHMDESSIIAAIKDCDVITTGVNDFSTFPEGYINPLDLYQRSPYLHGEDLQRVVSILLKRHPEYEADVQKYMTGHTSCFCNMFIMKRELFFRYCEWLFPILDIFVSNWDTSHLSRETLRTPGHLAERLLNIFLIHELRMNPQFAWKELQCVHYEHPEHVPEPRLQALSTDGISVVPVVLAADDKYVPMLTTTIQSMLMNASMSFHYDVIVMERDISPKRQQLMLEHFSQYQNVQLRFVNVDSLIRTYQLQTNNSHISTETYYRFLIQHILPDYDKVIYLDADLIVRGDISQLFETELGDNLVAATHDIDFVGNLDIKGVGRMAYAKDILRLKDPYSYFQAGVLVLNTAAMRELHSTSDWLNMASNSKYIYDDQDILNTECQGKVVYLDNAWNVMVNCGNRFKNVFSYAPANMFDNFMKAYANPKIVHYAGYEKPWKPGPCDMKELYWQYARETPFYEELLFMVCADRQSVANDIESARRDLLDLIVELTTHERAISEDSSIRRLIDPLLPLGSRRREFAKWIARNLRGRK